VLSDPRSGHNMQRAHTMVEAMVRSIIKNPDALWQMTSIASHDYYTYTHCVNVCMFLVSACQSVLEIRDGRALQRIGLGGLLHDVGKSQIPAEILNKPGKLTDEEFAAVKKHPQLGVDLARQHSKLPMAAGRIILGHHERFSGGGYPDGLRGEAISEIVRISTIVDVYDALTTKRSYGDARSAFEALKLMLQQMAAHFDGRLLRAFVLFLGPRQANGDARRQGEEIMGMSPGADSGPAAGEPAVQ